MLSISYSNEKIIIINSSLTKNCNFRANCYNNLNKEMSPHKRLKLNIHLRE